MKLRSTFLIAMTTTVLSSTVWASCRPGIPYEAGFENPVHGAPTSPVPVVPPQPMALTLAWCPVHDSSVAGYNVFATTISGDYPPTPAATVFGNPDTPTAQVENLNMGTKYYFAVTSFVNQQIQSAPSAEVSFAAFQATSARDVCVFDQTTSTENEFFVFDFDVGDTNTPVAVQTSSQMGPWQDVPDLNNLKTVSLNPSLSRRTVGIPYDITTGALFAFRLAASLQIDPGVDTGCP